MAGARKIHGLSPDMSFSQAAALIVATRTQEVFDRLDGELDPDRVHDARVATRRLRAALEVCEVCFPAKKRRKALRGVKRVADELGARRDPDVLLEKLATLSNRNSPAFAMLHDDLRREQRRADRKLAALLGGAKPKRLRRRLERLAS